MSHQEPALPFVTRRLPNEGDKSPSVMVLLHDKGDKEVQFLEKLKDVIDPAFFIISIRGPIKLSDGAYAWFEDDVIQDAFDYDRQEVEAVGRQVVSTIAAVHADNSFRGKHFKTVGLGQGATLAVSLIPQNPHDVQKVIALGGCVWPDWVADIDPDDVFRSDILIAHGDRDPHVSSEHAMQIAKELARLPVRSHYREYSGGHEITEEMVADIQLLTNLEIAVYFRRCMITKSNFRMMGRGDRERSRFSGEE